MPLKASYYLLWWKVNIPLEKIKVKTVKIKKITGYVKKKAKATKKIALGQIEWP